MDVAVCANQASALIWPLAAALRQLLQLNLELVQAATATPTALEARTSVSGWGSKLQFQEGSSNLPGSNNLQGSSNLPGSNNLLGSSKLQASNVNDSMLRWLVASHATTRAHTTSLYTTRLNNFSPLWPTGFATNGPTASSSVGSQGWQLQRSCMHSLACQAATKTRNHIGSEGNCKGPVPLRPGDKNHNWSESGNGGAIGGRNERGSYSGGGNSGSAGGRGWSADDKEWSGGDSGRSGGGNTENGGGYGDGGDFAWSRFVGLFGLAAAALAGGPLVALAEAKPKDSLHESAAAAQARLLEVWGLVETDLDRQKAQLPAGHDFAKAAAPQVHVRGSNITVTLPFHPAADFNAVMSRLLEVMQQGPDRGSISIRSHQYGASRTVTVERSQASWSPSRPSPAVRAQLFLPSDVEGSHGEITLNKSGALTDEEVEGLAGVLQQANTPVPGTLSRPGSFYHDPWLERIFPGWGQGWEQGRGVFEQFTEFGREMESMFEMLHQAESFFRRFGPPGEAWRDDDNSPHAVEFPPPNDTPAEGPYCPNPSVGTLPRPHVHRPPSEQAYRKGAGTGQYDEVEAKKQEAVRKLTSMGAKVYLPEAKGKMDWGILAGYENQKREIEDCLLLALQHPEVYDKVASATRATPGSNRPRAVLFEGPPGTGKTTSARVMSSQAALPLVYLPLEAVVSKWYGESEQQLSNVFKACEALGGCILFLDELDALATSREGDIHEASRRLLSVLLREMDGFDTSRRAVVIGATNRKQDLDAALLSRFDMLVNFGLPDEKCRGLILKQYAKQLTEKEIAELAARTPGMSGRDLRDVCEQTERRWASKIIRGEVQEDKLPTLPEYLESASERLHSGQHRVLPYGLEQHPQIL